MASRCRPRKPEAMVLFRWSAAHPIPSALNELLREAGGDRCHMEEPADLQLFLPPHLLLDAAAETGATANLGLQQSYTALAQAAAPGHLVNGERLLGLRPSEIAHWHQGHAPARPMELDAVDPLLAAVTLCQLNQEAEAVTLYEQLDRRSERGGAAPEMHYVTRLQPRPEALLAAWQRTKGQTRYQAGQAAQIQALASDLERQIGLTQEVTERANAHQRSQRQLSLLLERHTQAVRSSLRLQSRLATSQALNR